MFQRIQTLFIIISLAMWIVLGYYPIAAVFDSSVIYHLKINGIYIQKAETMEMYSKIYPLLIIYSVAAVIQLFSLFLFKRRTLQMRFCIYTALLQAGFMILVLYYVFQAVPSETPANVSWNYPAIIPVCSVILTLIAYRYILRDYRLIKSVDRIR